MAYKPHDLLQFEPKFKVESKGVIVYQPAYNKPDTRKNEVVSNLLRLSRYLSIY